MIGLSGGSSPCESGRSSDMHSDEATTHGVVPFGSASQDRERLSKQNIVATLRLRIKTLEERTAARAW